MQVATQIRAERQSDIAAIAELIRVAFAGAAHSEGTETAIVAALRVRGALTISLVAEDASMGPTGGCSGSGASPFTPTANAGA